MQSKARPNQKGQCPPARKAAWHRCQRRIHRTTDRATSQAGGHSKTPWGNSLPWPAGPRPLVHVGTYRVPPSPLLSPHLLFLKSRVRGPQVKALWSTSTAAGHLAKKGALSPRVCQSPVLATTPLGIVIQEPETPGDRTSSQTKCSSGLKQVIKICKLYVPYIQISCIR